VTLGGAGAVVSRRYVLDTGALSVFRALRVRTEKV
jgi:hypothetical protein